MPVYEHICLAVNGSLQGRNTQSTNSFLRGGNAPEIGFMGAYHVGDTSAADIRRLLCRKTIMVKYLKYTHNEAGMVSE